MMETPRVLRPMRPGEIVNEAFDLYKRNFTLFAGIGAAIYLPFALLSALTTNAPVLNALVTLSLYLPLIAVNAAIIKAVADRYLGREVTITGAWRYTLRRMVPYVATWLRASLLFLVAFLLLIVPAIFVAVWMFFLTSVMMVEDRFYRQAIQRSRELAAGQWARITVVGLCAVGVVLVVGIVVAGIDAAVVFGIEPRVMAPGAATEPLAFALIRELLSAGMQIVTSPITALMSVLLYFDVRVRKEGFDIEMLAQEMGEPSAAAGVDEAPARDNLRDE